MVETRRGYHPDNESFGAFLMSPLVFRWALEGAYEVQSIAARTTNRSNDPDARHMADEYVVNPIPSGVTVGGNARGAAQVENHSDHAVAHEFGTTKQRGYRDLARAGARVGEFRGLKDE